MLAPSTAIVHFLLSLRVQGDLMPGPEELGYGFGGPYTINHNHNTNKDTVFEFWGPYTIKNSHNTNKEPPQNGIGNYCGLQIDD